MAGGVGCRVRSEEEELGAHANADAEKAEALAAASTSSNQAAAVLAASDREVKLTRAPGGGPAPRVVGVTHGHEASGGKVHLLVHPHCSGRGGWWWPTDGAAHGGAGVDARQRRGEQRH